MSTPPNPNLGQLLKEIVALNRRVGRLEGEVQIILLGIGGILAGVVALVVKSL